MVFRRRKPLTVWQAIAGFMWPKGGWGRAFEYVKHRVRRLPDTPQKIGRGIWAGVFVAFTPFYGFHFFLAAGLALLMRGNIIASILGTFFGNPLTYVPIGVASLQTGYFLLGERQERAGNVAAKFSRAFGDLWHNFKAIFTTERTRWGYLEDFYEDIFFPYMVGGIIPGIIAATICYGLSVSLVTAYQARRRKVLRAKLETLKKNPE